MQTVSSVSVRASRKWFCISGRQSIAGPSIPLPAAARSQQFSRANEKDVQEILETLAALGRAHPGDLKGTYVR